MTMKPSPIYNCRDVGGGTPCGNYPARTGDDCTFCKGQPIKTQAEIDKGIADNMRAYWSERADGAEPFGGEG